MCAQSHQPIVFGAEGLHLALLSIATAESRFSKFLARHPLGQALDRIRTGLRFPTMSLKHYLVR